MLSTDASGNAGCYIMPALLEGVAYTSTFTGSTVTATTQVDTLNLSSLISDVIRYRVTGCTVNVTFLGDSTSSEGLITVNAQVPNTLPTTANIGTNWPNESSDDPGYRGRAQDGATFVARPAADECGRFMFPDALTKLGTTEEQLFFDGYEGYSVFLSGCEASKPNLFMVEVIQNLEAIPLRTSLLESSAKRRLSSADGDRARKSFVSELDSFLPIGPYRDSADMVGAVTDWAFGPGAGHVARAIWPVVSSGAVPYLSEIDALLNTVNVTSKALYSMFGKGGRLE